MWMVLFQRVLRQDSQRLDIDVYTPSRHPHTWGHSPTRHVDPYLYRNAPNRGVGAAGIQYWRSRGQASKDVPVARSRAPRAWTQRIPILLLFLPVPT